jgi:hypothetical protein
VGFDEKSLKSFPPGAMYRNPRKLALLKLGLGKEWQLRLNSLRLSEQRLRGPIGGRDIEDQLNRIARLTGAKNTKKKKLFD